MLVASHGFINPDIGVIAWVNLSRLTAPTMTGLKVVRQNAACLYLSMMPPAAFEAANAWLATFIADFNRRFSRQARFPKDLHRPVQESPDELRDIFAWHDVRTVSKSLTFQYDKVLYLMDPIEENSRLAGEKIKVLDYPDGTLAFQYGHRSLKCQAFDKLACVDQGQIVDNKRLGTVLRLAQVKQDERESEGKRERSKKSSSRKAQVRVQEQLRAINPVLADPSLFVASLKR